MSKVNVFFCNLLKMSENSFYFIKHFSSLFDPKRTAPL